MMAEQLVPEIEIAELIVSTLKLEVVPGDIRPDDALFGEGLGLDSIDALELALALSLRYGVEIKADDADTPDLFASLRKLTIFVNANRAT